MKTLTDKEIKRIVREIMQTEPYKTEFNNPYYRGVFGAALEAAMRRALEEASK